MTDFKYIDNQTVARVAEGIDLLLEQSPAVMRPMMRHLKKAKGKYIRAAAITAAAQSICPGGAIPESSVDLAIAIELLHLATLIHDDLIDGAETRRGVETLHRLFGHRLAILSGDYLFTKCFQSLLAKNNNRSADFAAAVSALCVGETLQNHNNHNYNLSKGQYFKIIAGKTAALFVLSLYGAAAECGAAPVVARRLARAGYYIGMVFQMTDDLLDYTGDSAKTKKSLRQDLAQGVVTYPLIHAMAACPAVQKKLESLPKRKPLNEAQLSEILSAVSESGGLAAAKDQAKVFYDRAARNIRLALCGQDGRALTELLNRVYERDH